MYFQTSVAPISICNVVQPNTSSRLRRATAHAKCETMSQTNESCCDHLVQTDWPISDEDYVLNFANHDNLKLKVKKERKESLPISFWCYSYLLQVFFSLICSVVFSVLRLLLVLLKGETGKNRPFPSSSQPPFQSEAKCEVIVMKISFHSY